MELNSEQYGGHFRISTRTGDTSNNPRCHYYVDWRETEFNIFNKLGGNTMSTNRNLLKSPVGSIQWMAAANPVTDKKTGKESYSVKLAFDIKKDAAYLKQISEINDAKVVTAQTYRGKQQAIKDLLATGVALVEAKSKFKPEVFDAAGNTIEEAPLFFSESSGTAQMIVEPYTSDKGGTINLVGIVIHSISSPESTTTGTGVDRETRLAQLRELAKQE